MHSEFYLTVFLEFDFDDGVRVGGSDVVFQHTTNAEYYNQADMPVQNIQNVPKTTNTVKRKK